MGDAQSTCGRSPSVISTKHEATRRRVSCPACRRRCVSRHAVYLELHLELGYYVRLMDGHFK